MRDPRSKKKRDLRKALYSGHGWDATGLYNELNPKCSRRRSWFRRGVVCDCYSWEVCHNREDEFVCHYVGVDGWERYGHPMAHSPSWYRRQLNRLQRCREKRALRHAFINDAWDDFLLPKNRREAAYYW